MGAVLLIKEDPGFVLVQYADYSVETTVAVAFVALVVAAIGINLLLKVLLFILRITKLLHKRANRRRVEKSRVLLNKGLIDLTEGRFAPAETKLTQLLDYTETPLLNYLAAARAAHQLGKYEQRDLYLKEAHEVSPDAEIAIGVTQGELQLSAKQTERAYATLTHLAQQAPKHEYVIKLLAKVYIALEDWVKLKDLLPMLKKKKLFAESKMDEIERMTYAGCLSESCSSTTDELNKVYQKIKKTHPEDTQLLLIYVQRLEALGDNQKIIERAIREALALNWDAELVLRYGQLNQVEAIELLQHAEQWQEDHRYDADLLLTLGRLARRAQLWGKAQSFLEASISSRKNHSNCLELAKLLEDDLERSEDALEYYKLGLEACVNK